MVKFVLLSSDDDIHVLACEIFVGAFKRVNWHLETEDLEHEETKKTKERRPREALRRRNTKERSCRETEDHLETILTNCPVFVCFLLQKKRVKRDFVEDIITMPDSSINEVQKNRLQCYPESST